MQESFRAELPVETLEDVYSISIPFSFGLVVKVVASVGGHWFQT